MSFYLFWYVLSTVMEIYGLSFKDKPKIESTMQANPRTQLG